LTGRFGNSEYGRSKKAGEDLFLEYEKKFLQAEANSSLFTIHSSLSEWYTLDGRRLNGKPTQRGVYVSNGRKVVIK
jgi:hypothetical protein